MKTLIHKFDSILYPIKLWIAVTNDGTELQDKFVYHDTREAIDITTLKGSETVTFHVTEKEGDKHKGVLIIFCDKKFLTIRTIAHEATHASDMIWNHIGERASGEEANAYLVGWIAQCIEEVKHYKHGQAS